MIDPSIHLPQHGLVARPAELKLKDKVFGAITPYNWSGVQEDPIGNIPGIYGITDREQGSSSSCTVQTMGYGFVYCTAVEINREDVYSKVRLPGGGAYLNAPLDYGRNTGFAPLAKYSDPLQETEDNMSRVIVVVNGDRIKAYQISYVYYTDTANIDSAATALQNHNYIHLGIRGSWSDGWNKSWVDPVAPAANNTAAWQHALFAPKEGLVLRNGIPAIKAKSSWNQHSDFVGNPSHCHYLNKNYFTQGVFEIIGVDIKGMVMQLINDKGTIYLVSSDKKYKIGIGNPDVLSQFFPTEPVIAGDTSAIPSIGTLADGVILHK